MRFWQKSENYALKYAEHMAPLPRTKPGTSQHAVLGAPMTYK